METPETTESVKTIMQYREPIPAKDVFKICILNDTNTISKMIVYQGSDKPIAKDSEIFSEYEQLQNESMDMQIVPSSMQIHPDDPIHVIKKKILHELSIHALSYGELYLFSKKQITLYLHELYLEITNNETEPLTLTKLGQLLLNLQIQNTETLSYFADMNQTVFNYNDIVKGLSNYTENLELLIPIGQRFSKNRDLLFSANPYNILQSNPLVFQPSSTTPLLMFDNHLLLTYGNMIHNTLYVCLAKDVLKYGERNSLMESHLLNLYYPILSKRDISSHNDLVKNQPLLQKETTKIMKPAFFQLYDNIDAFYNIYNTRTDELPYSMRGLSSFELTLHPTSKTNFPLDSVFKQVHATESIPFIKYNPGHRREPIYRLYTTRRTKNGKKIPDLTRVQISSYSKVSGKPRQLSFVVIYTHGKNNENLFVHISQNGNIIVNGTCSQPISSDHLNTLLLETVNPILSNINNLLESSGYSIAPFHNIYDERIEYNNLKYTCGIPLKAPVKSAELTSLLSNMFHVYETDINKGAILRYKRVENYKEMNAMNALITQIYKNTNDLQAVNRAVVENFVLSVEEANEHITTYLNDHVVINGNYVNKSVDVIDNPGFPCLIRTSREFATPEIVVDITDINSIHYIDQIHMYIDVFLRVTQYPQKSSINKDDLIKITTKTKKVEEVPVYENVITTSIADIQPFTLAITNDEDEDADADEDDEDDYKIMPDNDDEEEDDEDGDNDEGEDSENGGLLFDADSDEDDDEMFVGGNRTFFDKMKKLEPTLFRTKKEGRYDSYARVCPSVSSRQPIILTKDELDDLDEDSYEVAMPYGTDKENPHWYVCPRYWCLQTNKPMTDKQVAAGECGGKVIPGKSKNPPPGHYIYEFTDDRQHKDKDDNYRQHRPGFLGAKSHPDSCLPCCFKEMNTEQQISRRKECGVPNDKLRGNPDTINKLIKPVKDAAKPIITDDDDAALDGSAIIPAEKKVTRVGMNILGFDKFPIDRSRWGFLPLSVELFLHTDNTTSLSKNNPAIIRSGENPLLRHGVEYSQNQSFIACIADLYTYHNNVEVPSIPEMRKIIASKISLDIYIRCNNGSLVSIFQPKKTIVDDITVEKYKDTAFYQSFTDLSNTAQNNFLKDSIASYRNFRAFLKNDDSFIDHTYLWDIISSPDANIFTNGVNISLLEIVDNDITDNVALLCPTNSYSSKIFDLNKGTCIILKHNEFYEPIYMYGNTKVDKFTKKNAVKIFYQQNTPPNLLNVFNMINKTTDSFCKPQSSMPNVYDYKRNHQANDVYDILTQNNLVVKQQVRNYRGKTIAFMVSTRNEDTNTIYIPTEPSANVKNVPIIFTDGVTWLDYDITRDKLHIIASKTDGKLYCEPAFKVIEDGLIVGIFTETNQFIQVSTPSENIGDDGIPEYETRGYNQGQYNDADKSFATDTTGDDIRTQTVRNISLETQFYNSFRSKLRSLLSNYKYKMIRDAIVEIIDNKQYLYKMKMKKLEILIRYIMTPIISFVEFDETILNEVKNIGTLVDKDDLKRICLSANKLMCIPAKHLVSDIDNEKLYFSRISDELLRYNRIRLFLLDAGKFLNISNVDYLINDNELVMLHSLLTAEEFDNLKPIVTNKYIEHIPRDFANPYNGSHSSPDVKLDTQYADTPTATLEILRKDCVQRVKPVSVAGKNNWRKILHPDAVEHISKSTTQCSFYLLMLIMKEHLNISENIYQIKARLCLYYKPLVETELLRVCDLLEKQGKRQFVNMLKKKQITLETMIMNDDYIITAIDLWVFANALQLPIIIFDPNGFQNFVPDIDWLVLGGDPAEANFYFVRIESTTKFNVITPPSALRDLNGFQSMIESPVYDKNIQTLADYLPTHVLPTRKLNVRKVKMKK